MRRRSGFGALQPRAIQAAEQFRADVVYAGFSIGAMAAQPPATGLLTTRVLAFLEAR